MNILFLLLQMSEDEAASNMYSDLIEEFRANGHIVTVMAPWEKKTELRRERSVKTLRVNALPTQNIKSMVKKGIGLAMLPRFYKKAYKKYLKDEVFDWIFMPTPPITLVDFVSYVKKRTRAKFYLILRDIHPQSAASIGLIKNRQMYNYLKRRARRGYKIADLIGCMSQGNIEFIANRYPNLDKSKLVLLYNWMRFEEYVEPKVDIRGKYDLGDRVVVLFGGTIGLGQRVENIFDLAKHYSSNDSVVFLIVGRGVKKDYLEELVKHANINNVRFVDFLPRDEYMDFVKTADIGLISINENYKVPTCPSKAISYMSLKIPMFAMINPNSDYGNFIEDDAKAGYWVVGGDKENTYNKFDKLVTDAELRTEMGNNGYKFYEENLTSEKIYSEIIRQIEY